MRVLYGLARVPASFALDDPRLPGVELGPAPLRLNTEPLPDWAAPQAPGHAGRVAAVQGWLETQCGDYAPRLHRFVAAYLAFVAAAVAAHREELAARLARFDGLYAPEDWMWSAPRPLPRAWLSPSEGVAMAFWDGTSLLRLDAPDPPALPRLFPDPLGWWDEALPMSPARRPIPGLCPGPARGQSSP